jgi:hypothetical protein
MIGAEIDGAAVLGGLAGFDLLLKRYRGEPGGTLTLACKFCFQSDQAVFLLRGEENEHGYESQD